MTVICDSLGVDCVELDRYVDTYFKIYVRTKTFYPKAVWNEVVIGRKG